MSTTLGLNDVRARLQSRDKFLVWKGGRPSRFAIVRAAAAIADATLALRITRYLALVGVGVGMTSTAMANILPEVSHTFDYVIEQIADVNDQIG